MILKRKFIKLTSNKKTRNSRGIYIVEIMVAMAVGAIITFALLNAAGLSLRHATATQNEVYANTIIRMLLESSKQANYESLASNLGQYTLLTNRTTAGQTGPPIRELPLQLDTVNKSWENPSINGRFRGDVTYAIEAGVDPDSVKITVSVSWVDSTRTDNSHKRTVSKSSIIYSEGMKAWE